MTDPSEDPVGYAGDTHLLLAEALGRQTRDPSGMAGAKYLQQQIGDDTVGWFSAAIGLLAVAQNLLQELAAWKMTMEGHTVSIITDDGGRVHRIENETGTAEDLIERWVDGYKVSMMEKLMEPKEDQ